MTVQSGELVPRNTGSCKITEQSSKAFGDWIQQEAATVPETALMEGRERMASESWNRGCPVEMGAQEGGAALGGGGETIRGESFKREVRLGRDGAALPAF